MGKIYDGASGSTNGYVNNTAENRPSVPRKVDKGSGFDKIGSVIKNVLAPNNPSLIIPSKEYKQIKEIDEK